jgi:hypothetical protein
LHNACHTSNATNLDIIEFLLNKGAHPNAQDSLGLTALIYTTPGAPSAAKFLLNWSTTDVNIITRSGASFLARVRESAKRFADKVAFPDSPADRVPLRLLLQQWCEIEEMLVERGAHDTGITTL